MGNGGNLCGICHMAGVFRRPLSHFRYELLYGVGLILSGLNLPCDDGFRYLVNDACLAYNGEYDGFSGGNDLFIIIHLRYRWDDDRVDFFGFLSAGIGKR